MTDAPPYRLSRVSEVAALWRDVIFLLAVVLIPLLAYGGNLAFSPLTAALGALWLPVIPPERRRSVGLALLAALLAWALVSTSWAYYQPPHVQLDRMKNAQSLTALKLVLQLALYGAAVAAAAGVRRQTAERGLTILGVGLAIVAAIVILEFLSSQQFYLMLKAALHQKARPDLAKRNVARAFYPIALLIWPVLLNLWRRDNRWRALGVATALTAFVGAILYRTDAAVLALAVGAAAGAASLRLGRVATLIAMGATSIYFVLTPLILGGGGLAAGLAGAGGVAKASWGARIDIWRFTAHLIEQRPFLGWGLDASRAFPGAIPLHPHDAALQLWLELGAVGAGLVVTYFAWLLARIEQLRARDPALAAAQLASLSAYLVIGALSFGVWQEWWLALGALTMVAFAALTNARRLPRRRRSLELEGLVPLA
jgi:O-antigen ligase